MPDGKPANEFAFDAKPKNREFAVDIIKTLHDQWKALMSAENTQAEPSMFEHSLADI